MVAQGPLVHDGAGWVDIRTPRRPIAEGLRTALLGASLIVGAPAVLLTSALVWSRLASLRECLSIAAVAWAVLAALALLLSLLRSAPTMVSREGVRTGQGRRARVFPWSEVRAIAMVGTLRPHAPGEPYFAREEGVLLLCEDSVDASKLRLALAEWAPTAAPAGDGDGAPSRRQARALTPGVWTPIACSAIAMALAAVAMGLQFGPPRMAIVGLLCAIAGALVAMASTPVASRAWCLLADRRGVDIGDGAGRRPWSSVSMLIEVRGTGHGGAVVGQCIWPQSTGIVIVGSGRALERLRALRAAAEGPLDEPPAPASVRPFRREAIVWRVLTWAACATGLAALAWMAALARTLSVLVDLSGAVDARPGHESVPAVLPEALRVVRAATASSAGLAAVMGGLALAYALRSAARVRAFRDESESAGGA